jgi:ATP-dependent exoDNAse (exonuclease V) beta subunit
MADEDDEVARERNDAAARETALDIGRSFLVQAPAGSGKTGLLIQRYLALLAHVDRPERIVAMTFTRKAASEMRERVLSALRDAVAATPVDASQPHAVATRRLALAALAQDEKFAWQLIAQPSRLRMLTIDALAAALARQAPITTGLGALPDFVDDATPLYLQAVRAALAAAGSDDPAWRRFLARLDNDADRAVSLLASLLARRDQWLRLPFGAGRADLRSQLERGLRAEVERALVRTRGLFPAALAERIAESARYAAAHLQTADGAFVSAQELEHIAEQGGLPRADAAHLGAWRALADFLLTKNDEPAFRQKLETRGGFPAKGKEPGCAARVAAKQAMANLLDVACGIPGLAQALHGARTLPEPAYADAAWEFVDATLALLPQIASHLLTVFASEGAADFSEATLRTLVALGDADDPGDLLLAVDYRLSHLLVDEFQDTSWTHRELIARLTAGWEPGDGRTLFAVGDPMQSIYRFREAEVGIFLEAQATASIARIPVVCLDLARNFRSQAPVVDWVNTVFQQVLPPVSDPERGAVAYKRVLATRRGPGDISPTLDIVTLRAEEAARVVSRIREAQGAGSNDIAILVQMRRHLDLILPALRNARIDYTAVDLETLAQRLATRDLTSLVRVLTQPADRLAGLALLRAPWCGLLLPDLLIVATGSDRRGILDAIADGDVVACLSADGHARVARLRAALHDAISQRGRASLAQRARAAWLALGGPACGDGPVDVAGAERFFALLAQHERGGDLADWDAFAAATDRLFAQSDTRATSSVQVMTVHKAKGLEFDTVIMPGLDRAGGRGDEPALRWKQREHEGDKVLLLAPLRAREGALSEPDPVYQYLKALDATEDAAERGRLLYVGCTRARRRLHLVAVLDGKPAKDDQPAQWRDPVKRSALARLWPALHAAAPLPPADAVAAASGDEIDADDDDDATPQAQPLRRISATWAPPDFPDPIPIDVRGADAAIPTVAFDWAHATAAAIGTVAHRLLAQIAVEDLATWNAERVAAQRQRITAELAGEGVPAAERAEATERIVAAIARTLTDARGRWLFDATHEDAQGEWALAGVDGETLCHVTIDRTFVAAGTRWIVDFKTGRHEGGDPAAFLDREEDRYRTQLERYARLVRELDPRPIRLALYFPLVDGGWREWAYSG